jgi:YD repeat-containing protein
VYGIGGWRFYTDAGSGSYTSPAGDNGTLSKNLSTGVFTYTTPDGRTWNFNSSGLETSIVSADGQEALSFTYTSGVLTGMTAIDGGSTTFSYTSGLLTGISTAGSRSYSLTDSGTNVSQITNPDSGVHTFTYDGSHHLTGDTLANVQHAWAYNSSTGALATLTWGGSGSPSVTALSPAASQGLSAVVRSPGQATVTEPLGHKTAWQLDSSGRPLQEVAADGGVWKWTLDSNGRVLTATDPLLRSIRSRPGIDGIVPFPMSAA